MTQGQDSGRTAALFNSIPTLKILIHFMISHCHYITWCGPPVYTTTLDKWKKHLPSQSFEACVFVTEVVPDYK